MRAVASTQNSALTSVERWTVQFGARIQMYLYFETSQGSQLKFLTYDRGYDNALLGQGYRTPRGAVIDGYGDMVE
jgi:hypothetical protein